MHTIRLINYMGDFDDLHDVNLIGPYLDTQSAMDDINKWLALPGVNGSLDFELSELSGPDMVSPVKLAGSTNYNELVDSFFGY